MSWGLGRREKKKKDCPPVQFCAQSVQSGLSESRMAQGLGSEAQRRLFEQIRQAVPLVDAAIGKIIRLVGDFELECSNRQAMVQSGAGGRRRKRTAAVSAQLSGRPADLRQCGG